MLIFVFVLNAVISWVNAWGCGKSWAETRANGGLPHFMNWCGAIMSAAGFTWCYLVLLSFAGGTIPFDHTVAGKTVHEPLLTVREMDAFANLGYLVIIAPILGSGIAITIKSWRDMWRERTFGATARSAWNTFAMGENIYSATSAVPDAIDGISSFFSSDDDEGWGWVIGLVVLAVLGGVFTTRTIIRTTMKRAIADRALELGITSRLRSRRVA
jgi:hypothetical protein